MSYLWIALGGALGSVGRFWCSGLVARHFGETFPWGTFAVNVIGCFAIGFFGTVTGPDGRWLAPSRLREFFMIGVCGGFTTFSSFSLQTLNLMEDGEWLRAGANAVTSVVVCLLAVWLGHIAAMSINSMKSQ